MTRPATTVSICTPTGIAPLLNFAIIQPCCKRSDEAIQWIIFTQFLIELSQDHVPDIYYYPEANKWLKTIYEIYTEYGYQKRIKQAPTSENQSVKHIKLFN